MSPDIPYGREYPEQPWIDRDGELIDERPVDVHRGQARIAYRVAGRYADKLLHVTGLGWHAWDGAEQSDAGHPLHEAAHRFVRQDPCQKRIPQFGLRFGIVCGVAYLRDPVGR